jgi:hypothetical protein
MSSSGPQINYFPSFQTLSAIKHVDPSAKFVCGKQYTGRGEAQSCETVNKVKKKLSVHTRMPVQTTRPEGAAVT